MATGTSPRRATLAGATALTTAVLPVFLVGALGASLRADLGLSETGLGAAVTVLFVTAAVTATAAGQLTERVGAGVALRAGVTISMAVAVAVAALADGWWSLVLPMAVGGFAVALIDTGAARAFADRVPTRSQGFAFGIKEASIPGASMLAGLSLPTVATVLGWRASFVAAAGVALVVLVLLPSPRGLAADHAARTPDLRPPGRVATAAVLRFSAGVGLGTGAATAAATFLVPGVISQGVSPSVAGLVLSVASVTSVVARVAVGRWADREQAAPVPILGGMLVAGGLAALLLAGGPPLPALVPAAMVVLGAGWGWTGLAFLAVVRANPHAPAAAAGVVLTGLGLGSALGPFGFGALVDRGSYAVAWAVVCAAMLTGAALAVSARRALAPTTLRAS